MVRRFLRPALLGLGVPRLVVVVAVEHDPLALVVGVLDHGVHGIHEVAAARLGLELVGQLVDGLGHDRVQNRVGEGQRHAGSQRSELELVAGERERRGPVAVAAVPGHVGEDGRAELHRGAGRVGIAVAGRETGEHLLELGPEEDRDDRGRRLVGAETVVLADVGHRGAEQALVLVDGLHHRGAEEQEAHVLRRRRPRARAGCGRRRCPSTSCCACPSRSRPRRASRAAGRRARTCGPGASSPASSAAGDRSPRWSSRRSARSRTGSGRPRCGGSSRARRAEPGRAPSPS